MASGAADPAQALPIDIAYNKFADWLVDRRKVPPDWRKKLAGVRAKVSAALRTLPQNKFPDVDPECTGYLEAKRIRDVLVSDMPESRGLFGRLSGAAGDWDGIVSAYEKDALFLGEAAQIMVQSTNYDIPYQKRQIAKTQQQLADLERKESEMKRNSTQSAAKYQQACQELGIPGVNIRAELMGLGSTLPKIFGEVVEGLCSDIVGSALSFYRAFTSYALAQQGDDSVIVLPTLTDLRVHPPDISATPNLTSSMPFHQSDNRLNKESMPHTDVDTGEIDWGVEILDADANAPVDIDWDVGTIDDANSQDSSVPKTNLQDPKEEVNNEGKALPDDNIVDDPQTKLEIASDVDSHADINWDIDVEEDGVLLTSELPPNLGPEREVKGADLKNLGPGGTLETSWFVKAENRNRLLDDLFELKVFLKQRIQEIESEGTAALQNQVQVVAPTSVPQHGCEVLAVMAAEITKALNLVTNRTTCDLILICTSLRYLDRLEASLMQRKQTESNIEKNMRDLSSKRVELRNAQALLWPKQEAVLIRTQGIKNLVEQVLSAQYNGRKVNIIGEINTLLGQI